MTTASLHPVSAISGEAPVSRWRPSIEVEQVRASWNRADQLFRAIRDRDVDAAMSGYADGASIIHPILGTVTAAQLQVALTAFVSRTKAYQLRHEIRLAGPFSAQVAWSIDHVLFVTGRRIRMTGVSHLVFEGGRVVRHEDHMSLRAWSRQALGLKGLILSCLPGWGRFIQREMRYSLGLHEGRR